MCVDILQPSAGRLTVCGTAGGQEEEANSVQMEEK